MSSEIFQKPPAPPRAPDLYDVVVSLLLTGAEVAALALGSSRANAEPTRPETTGTTAPAATRVIEHAAAPASRLRVEMAASALRPAGGRIRSRS